MHAKSASLPRPAKRRRGRRLADYQPVPDGAGCLTLLRTQQLFRGAAWKPPEEQHCQSCAWCWYFVSHDEAHCFKARQLLEIASGREPTKEEWEHAANCPSCAYDYDLLRRADKTAADGGRREPEARANGTIRDPRTR